MTDGPHPPRPTHEVVPPEYDWDGYGFDTRQVHAGEVEDPAYGARTAPVYLSAAFRFDSFEESTRRFGGQDQGQIYSRNLNPTNGVAERRVASLENGAGAIAVASGQAAISAALLAIVGHGERFVSTASIYSGTRILFERSFGRFGVGVDYVWDPDDEGEWERAIGPDTKAIFTETIPNPKNDVVDIPAVARIAARHGIPLIVDNTIGTPALIRPLDHGAHVVVHSGTKFLTGHGAAISGVIVDGGTFDWASAGRRYPGITERPAPGTPSVLELSGRHAYEAFVRAGIVNDLGPALSPVHAFLLQQGVETLSLRVERHVDNSLAIARWLAEHPLIESVDYAGLPGHPQHAVAERLLGGRSGSVFAATVTGGAEAAAVLIDSLRVFSRMTNIGDVRSMVLHPATTTHLSFAPELRERLGITDGLVRLSVGIETVDDLIADLDAGLAAVGRHLGR
ncbi:MAG: O-acetylhomoserine aminocarboxypropyltransferase/cysteine synthase family protein [Mycetocola reblochoni]|uniref:homocysteine desulfhydrase n=2 Tax=Mycetocola reblochoni TaxID=331618 RepID=A0A1R4IXW1_9MICO|nr:PLP-dependent transferase [Mycetocola reblochoni]RLP70918.1 O-acetylhomoserine aminocarboxypropyltransferase/cysteine synthase [Mycetocola reblochoni]SJN24538.1 O-acetylhomoserine sulfhydrylase / O-succinylhomoserine sulfhydrylase [Mycetocola reblochoni REB411]